MSEIVLPPFADGVNVGTQELLQYRGRSALLDLSSNSQIRSHLAGTLIAKTKGRGMEFDEARHYQVGDDIRAIDWRITARTGKVHTKLYREERERPVYLLVDLSHRQYFGSQLLLKSVQICHLAALIGWSAINNGDRIGALLFNDFDHRELKPKARQRGVLGLIEYLVKIHQQGLEAFKNNQRQEQRFDEACLRLRRVVKPGSLIFLLSDFAEFSDSAKHQLQLLNRHNELIACQIRDPLEHTLPDALSGTLAISDGQQRKQFGLSGEQKRVYHQHAEDQQQQRLSMIKQLRIPVLQFSSHQKLLDQLKGQML